MESTALEKVDKEKIEKSIAEFKPNPAFVAAGAMLPKSYKDVMELSAILAKSGVVPTAMVGRPEACAVAIMLGLELGISPTQAVQNIMVVNGRPSVWGDLVKALVVGSGKCLVFDEDPAHVALEQGYGRCRVVRRQEFGGGENESVFSIEDAKRAKLWTKEGPWQTYPGRMLMFRARSWACRDLFGDVLKGMQMREELADYEIVQAQPVERPERVKRAQTAVDATIVAETKQTTQDAPKPSETQSEEAERGSEKPEATVNPEKLDPAFKITEERRKTLFNLRQEAKISIAKAREWLNGIGVKDSSQLTNEQADKYQEWIVANAETPK